MAHLAGILFFLLLAGTKLLLAPSIMLAAGFGFIETMIITYVGALMGATTFYYFGVAIFKWLDELTHYTPSQKHVFTKKARTMVKVKIRYGIMGIALLAPIISIPISALIVAKFFPGKNKVIGIYAIILVPIAIGLTFLSEPVIAPILALVKRILNLN